MRDKIRDIHQLKDSPPFAMTAVESLFTVEAMLQDALRYVPYCDDHLSVWSPHFARIIVESASQIDSLWKATTTLEDPKSSEKRLELKHHRKRFGKLVSCQRVVHFAGAVPVATSPFGAWAAGTSPPTWWSAYNKLKHDRFSNQKHATLEFAVQSVGAFVLAIVYSGVCDFALISASLLDSGDCNPWAFTRTGMIRDITFDCRAKIESKMFAHPLGVFGVDNYNLSNYWMSDSARFNAWWALNAAQFTSTGSKDR